MFLYLKLNLYLCKVFRGIYNDGGFDICIIMKGQLLDKSYQLVRDI